jgi:single-strand DNA-binding protein
VARRAAQDDRGATAGGAAAPGPGAEGAGTGRAGPGLPPARNEVLLVGRVAAAAEERELPSGDRVCTFRLVVDRPPPRPLPRAPARATGRTVTVDTLDCAAWAPGVRRTARGLAAGDVVEVSGALRRRFWRAGPTTASRCEVEVTGLRRLARAAEPGPARARPARAPAPSPAPRDEPAAHPGPAPSAGGQAS